MVGERLGHYEILEKIGAGGMGEVFRARDTRLGRDVALKLLPAGLAGDAASLRRLRREARTVASLNHPHIVTLHSVEEAGGVSFLTMELLDGRGLDRMTGPSGLPLPRILEIGAAVADALAAAHARGLVHRDIKPANVAVTEDGRVKVLDFGLAATAPESASGDDDATRSLSTESALLGTVPYMSPEQVRGQAVDLRSDIFSLGVLLYEASTGQRPFRGETGPDVMSSILRDAPIPITQLRPDLPRRLEDVVARCLEKEPEDRFPAASDVRDRLEDLRRDPSVRDSPPPPPTPHAARKRLAVLPFENLSGDPEQEFFVDGMHDETVATLAGVRGLEVISRTSVRHYKGRDTRLSEIARELRVSFIVEGSVRVSGHQVRITIQLIDASMDRHLWANSYQREQRDILALQGEVAAAIAREVKATLTPEEEAQLAHARPVDPECYFAYLKGRHHWGKRTPEGITRAGEFFQEAIDFDPTYAMAHAGLADCYLMKGAGFYALQDPREAYPRASSAARRAIELDERLAEPHASLGYVKTFFDWDWDGAAAEFRTAIELNPGYATGHLWSALRLSALGRFEEALAAIDRAFELDPLSIIVIADKGFIHIAAREYDAAVRLYRSALEVDPRFAVASWGMGLALEQLGRLEEAESCHRRAVELAADNVVYHAALARTVALRGRADEASRRLREITARAGERFVPAADVAFVHIALGETDRAIRAFEEAYEHRENLVALMNLDARLDPLRPDPRFQELRARVGFPE